MLILTVPMPFCLKRGLTVGRGLLGSNILLWLAEEQLNGHS